MNNQEWTGLIDGIFAAHGKSTPSERVAAKWFEHVYDVPMRAAQDIARDLERSGKLEQNVGAQFLACWHSWRAAHPDQMSREPRKVVGCADCEHGEIWWAKENEDGSWGWGISLCMCCSSQGTSREAIRSRENHSGLFVEVFRWITQKNREKFGFYDRYGYGQRFDIPEMIRKLHCEPEPEESAALEACDG